MKSHLTFFCFSGGWVGCVPGKGRGLPPSSDPRLLPPGPELKNKRFGRKKRRSKTCCCLQPHQLLPLASRQRRPWRVGSLRIGQGGVGKGAQFGVTGQTWRFWGGWREEDPHTHAPASRRERAQGLFCDAGFLFASASALGHGVSYFVSHHGDRGGQGWQGVVPWALGLVLGYMVPG